MTIENEFYYIYEGEECWAEKLIDDDDGLYGEEENVTVTKVKVNPAHYYKGYFFYNDMDYYDEKDEHYPSCFNSMEDVDTYIDSNNSSGHFQMTYVEEWVNGEKVNTVQTSDENGWLDD